MQVHKQVLLGAPFDTGSCIYMFVNLMKPKNQTYMPNRTQKKTERKKRELSLMQILDEKGT